MSDRRTRILEASTRCIARDGVRGLRVEEVAAGAGVSTGLIYYHFKDRPGLLRATLDHVNERTERYTEPRGATARERLEETLLLELQDTDEVREVSAAWGELRATTVFDPQLRDQLRLSTAEWTAELAGLVRAAHTEEPARRAADPEDSAGRLVALVEGLSELWLSGSMELDRARALLRGAVALELG
ncbi:TetR/AcrR family transcriptional regulator [Streptomyces albiaxialis]|uniref:TetR/AcrR family transcriptional regulator n=1 Tax=Streptomyces albiaxialis TaxID=329523 RepID=A0ABN2VIF3_9ACTN